MPSEKISSQDLLHQVKIAGKIPELIAGILQQRILEETAQKLGLVISDEELQVGADQFRSANKLDSTAATQAWLRDRMLSLDDFEQLITTNLLTHKVAQHLFAAKVEPFFHQHLSDYGGAIMSEVVVSDYNLAIELFYAIQEGEMSFADVARDYANDMESQRRSGYLGLVKRCQMNPEISAPVFAAQPPQLLLPIRVVKLVHLILVSEIVLPVLTTSLREQIIWELFQEWLQQQIADRRSAIC
jgi:PPIC-type PPIASE domain